MKKHVQIYQLSFDSNLIFRDYDFVSNAINLKKFKTNPEYELKYEYDYKTDETKDDYILEDLFTIFNCDRPEDFTGHSLSVSDIIVLDDKAYFCDSIGFQEI